MLKKQAVEYFNEGYNCSQCILKAANDIYRLNLPTECVNMCIGVNNGFGIGGVCSVLVACIMVISIMCPDDIKFKRIKLLDEFMADNGSINCGEIRKSNCINIIEDTCDMLEKIINEK